ncbi:hypothetical protein C0993_006559 [Termitomyces sp. T159_Od127]|nr:hypothetical protein C0993_006559 [Termitomyces sp. T159_Od127]
MPNFHKPKWPSSSLASRTPPPLPLNANSLRGLFPLDDRRRTHPRRRVFLSRSPAPAPSPDHQPESPIHALDALIDKHPAPTAPPASLREALAELVGLSSVYASRRLSPTARDPADEGRPRMPPPHYDRIELLQPRKARTVRNNENDAGSGWAHVLREDESKLEPALLVEPTFSAPALNAIHAQYDNFLSHSDVRTVIDIGAGSGSWISFARYKLSLVSPNSDSHSPSDSCSQTFPPDSHNPPPKLIAVDLNPLPDLQGVHCLTGDIRDLGTLALIDAALGDWGSTTLPTLTAGMPTRTLDVILCDVTPVGESSSISRMHAVGESLDVCRRVWEFARVRLRTAEEIGRAHGGVLLMRHVPHPLLARFRYSALVPHFQTVKYIKPDGEWRTEGGGEKDEGPGSYLLCCGYKGTAK